MITNEHFLQDMDICQNCHAHDHQLCRTSRDCCVRVAELAQRCCRWGYYAPSMQSE